MNIREIKKLITTIEKRKSLARKEMNCKKYTDRYRLFCGGEIFAYDFILGECRNLISN